MALTAAVLSPALLKAPVGTIIPPSGAHKAPGAGFGEGSAAPGRAEGRPLVALRTLLPSVVVQLLGRVLLFATPGTGTPGFPVLCLPELAQSHVRRAGDAIQPPHHLSPPSPPALNLSQHQGFSHESALHIRWPKYWSFSFRISPPKEYSG